MIVTPTLLYAVAPTCRHPDTWAYELSLVCAKYEIESPLRVAAFLGETAYESSSFNKLEENLLYSAERLMVVWPSRFYSIAIARLYQYNAEKLANKVYAGRMGNGNEASGDGYRYRGRGIIQLTGRDNYAWFAEKTGIPVLDNPDLLLEKPVAAASAAEFWKRNDLNSLADKGDFEALTRRITGAIYGELVGYLSRLRYYERARKALGLGPSGA